MVKIASSDITPEEVYLSRRQFMKASGVITGAFALAACGLNITEEENPSIGSQKESPGVMSDKRSDGYMDELGDPVNSFEEITTYNNFYEFTTDKQGVARLAEDYITRPWTIEVGGLVRNPKMYDIEEILKNYPREERVYRLRCVEGWSMTIPWMGFPLKKLLSDAEPLADAGFVRFETIFDPDHMPGQRSRWYNWPYVEGLRIDEAMHDLTLIATGLYGKELLPQNGAPLRLVVPWKYGFKSIKSIVKIELVDKQPTSLWMAAAPNEYGFYANVNPKVDHPRWSQSSERRIGELGRRKTLMFNGYEEEVASLYSDMDLSANY